MVLSKDRDNTQWFFLDSGACDPAFNMAVDEYFATTAQLKQPLLRFYQWRPFTISLGYNQRSSDLDLARCEEKGLGLVRRPTGGRAVLHADEVTYAVIIPRSATAYYQSKILDTYNFISRALVNGLNILGLDARLERGSAGNTAYAAHDQSAIPCFSASAQYEVLINGRKLIGSAQRRFEAATLQHGSILTGRYHLDLPEYLNLSKDKARITLKKMLDSKSTSINEILPEPASYSRIVTAITEGFSREYGIQFETRSLSNTELNSIRLLQKKYEENWR